MNENVAPVEEVFASPASPDSPAEVAAEAVAAEKAVEPAVEPVRPVAPAEPVQPVKAEAAPAAETPVQASVAAPAAQMETTASVKVPAHFEGVVGAINVSIVAFSIVFAVLIVLTGTIYAMKLFSFEEKKTSDDGPVKTPAKSAGSAPARITAAAPVQAVQSGPQPMSRVVAAITAAIMASTGGRGQIVSIGPAAPADGPSCVGDRWTRRWREAGILTLNGNRLSRAWK